jgi:hypothetical protein
MITKEQFIQALIRSANQYKTNTALSEKFQKAGFGSCMNMAQNEMFVKYMVESLNKRFDDDGPGTDGGSSGAGEVANDEEFAEDIRIAA